jgi:hypothetical protein
MRKHEIEVWALRLVEQVNAKQRTEDSHVELKAEWPADSNRAARRLAAHANAAAGEPILWLIGVDEEQGVTGAPENETADWLAGVRSEFDALMPRLIADLAIPVDGKTVVALLFETDRLPFVVKNQAFGRAAGSVEREVPWREGTAVRSATREDLLRVLSPLARLPEVETLGAALCVLHVQPGLAWSLDLYLYVTPTGEERLVIPVHRCEFGAVLVDGFQIEFASISFGCEPGLNTATRTEIILEGPGLVSVTAYSQTPTPIATSEGHVRISGRMRPIKAHTSIPVELDLAPKHDPNFLAKWTWGRHDCW